MEKSLSLGLIGLAVVLTVFSSTTPASAGEQPKVSTPAPQVTQISPQEAAAVKKVNEMLLRPIEQREKSRNVETYNGMAPWFGNDAISRTFDNTGAYLKRAWSELSSDLAPQRQSRSGG